VIARTTSFSFKGKAVDVRQIGRDLGVRYVLEGGVRRLGTSIGVNVQLTDAENSTLVWTDRFVVDRSDLSTALDEIVTRLARSLHLTMMDVAARRLEREQSVNPEAADFVMRGWAALYRLRTDETLRDAEIHFERALELDPQSIDARIGLATALTEFVGNSRAHLVAGVRISPETDLARSAQLLTEALSGDPNNPKLIFTLGRLRGLQTVSPTPAFCSKEQFAPTPTAPRLITCWGLPWCAPASRKPHSRIFPGGCNSTRYRQTRTWQIRG